MNQIMMFRVFALMLFIFAGSSAFNSVFADESNSKERKRVLKQKLIKYKKKLKNLIEKRLKNLRLQLKKIRQKKAKLQKKSGDSVDRKIAAIDEKKDNLSEAEKKCNSFFSWYQRNFWKHALELLTRKASQYTGIGDFQTKMTEELNERCLKDAPHNLSSE